jgi:NTE family protein
MLRRSCRFALLVLLQGVVLAQDPPTRERVGLVLSGGGARGLTHIGVLQVLEELRVPVDCVAGTSMGAIIGGLYSYGLDPYEIERVVTEMDWGYLLQDGSVRTDLAIRRRIEAREFQIDVTLGFRDGAIALPKGLVQGQNLGFALDQLVLEAFDVASFDDLSLPFRCVAADIGDGSRIVFDKGDLARAMRASMALPGVFAPVEWQGRLLVDGGIIDNLPVEAARAMGAKRLIAVDIGTPPVRREDIQNLLGITSQMVSLLTQEYVNKALASLTQNDLLIQPQLGTLTSSDFTASREFIRIGRAQALAQTEALRKFAVSEAEFATWRARHRRVVRPLPIVVGIEVTGCERVDEQLLISRIQQPVGEPLDPVRLKRGLETAYGLDGFELVRCRVVPVPTSPGECTLLVEVIEKSWGPGLVRFGLDAGTDFQGGDRFSIGGRLVITDAGPLGAEWATDVRVGTDTLISTEWFQPLDLERRLFVEPSVGFSRGPVRAFVLGQTSEFSTKVYGGAFDVGSHLIPNAEVRVGLDRGYGEYELESGLAPPGEQDFDDGGAHATFLYDSLDRSSFPTAGVLTGGSWQMRSRSLGADTDYEFVNAGLFAVTSAFGQALALRMRGQWETSGDVAVYDQIAIGGLFELSGLGNTAVLGPEAGVVSLITYRGLSGASGRLHFPVYVGASLEAGGGWEWSELADDDLVIAGSLFLGIDSLLGPIFFAFGAAEGGERAVYFSIGQIGF